MSLPALRACRWQKETRATRAAIMSCGAVGCTTRLDYPVFKYFKNYAFSYLYCILIKCILCLSSSPSKSSPL